MLDNESAIESLIRQGCVIQLNARSTLRGQAPLRLRRRCYHLLKRGLVHVVASDSHGPGSSTPLLAEAARMLARKFSTRLAREWTCDNPQKILDGSEL